MPTGEGRLVLLTIDSLRLDRRDILVDTVPRLGADFATFKQCLSRGVDTPLTFSGIITGTVATGEGSLPTQRATIAEAISGSAIGFSNNGHLNHEHGYDRGFESFDVLSLPDDRSLLNRLKQIDWLRENRFAQAVYQRVVEFYRNSEQYEGAATVPTPYIVAPTVARFVRRQFERNAPKFVWSHFMDPHSPYHSETAVGPVPNLTTAELQSLNDRVHDQDAAALTGSELEQVQQLYDGNVRYLARELSDLLDWLATRPWYGRSMVVVTADHDELLGEHGQLSHPWDAEPYDELVDVPLFVKFPDGAHAGGTVEHLTCHADCYRSILKRFGGEVSGPTLLD